MLRLAIAFFICIVDQISKSLIITNFVGLGAVPMLPFLNYTYALNNGAAFGLFAESPGWQRWFFVLVALVVSTIIIIWMKRLQHKDRWEGLALACILGGALGNLIDRIMRGHVVDFIDFHVGNWHWYTFNIADIAICMGAIMLAATSWVNTVHFTDKR